MSLLDEAFTPFVLLEKTRQENPYGGWDTVWRDGVTFDAAITYRNGVQAKIAEKQGVTDLFTVTTQKTISLAFGDTIRRESDGLLLRITTNGAENRTPATAGLNMRQVDAEKWKIPDTDMIITKG